MKVTFARPRPELRSFVQAIWSFESEEGLPLAENTVVTPTGSSRLIISCDNSIVVQADGKVQENPDQTIYLLGVRDIPVGLHTRPARTRFFGVDFHPHGAAPFVRIPMFELTNQLVPLAELFRDLRAEVNRVLAARGEAEAIIGLIQGLLVERLRESGGTNRVVEFCVDTIRKTSGLVSIVELEARTGYSRRYLEVLFKNHVGITPKALARIVRFQKLYTKWARAEDYEQIFDELYDSYYDQAHFAKEFKRMTGFTPQRFVRNVSNEFGRRLAIQ